MGVGDERPSLTTAARQHFLDAAIDKAAEQAHPPPHRVGVDPLPSFKDDAVVLSHFAYLGLFIGVARRLPPPFTLRVRFTCDERTIVVSWADDPCTCLFFSTSSGAIWLPTSEDLDGSPADWTGFPASLMVCGQIYP